MLKLPKLGKFSPDLFESLILPHTGAKRDEVLKGPHVGHDNGIVDLGNGQVLVVTSDPITYIPELGPRDSAMISVHLIASDLATSGIMPQYAIINFNLPPHMLEKEFERYWMAMHEEFEKIGTAVVAGHTGRYSGCDYSIIGSGALMAVGAKNQYLSPDMASPGDQIILTKGAMEGTSGLLARVFPETLETIFDSSFVQRSQAMFKNYSTIEDAQTAVSVGIHDEGVTSMHDATEGGVLGALYELAEGSNAGIHVELEKIPVRDEVLKICSLFKLDPYRSLSEGTLLITARPHKTESIISALAEKKISSVVIGELVAKSEGRKLSSAGKVTELKPPQQDNYWAAYQRVSENGWK